jgi:hypothetical protein
MLVDVEDLIKVVAFCMYSRTQRYRIFFNGLLCSFNIYC